MACELLIPVGSMENLLVAIAGGADAVYLGGASFNLRSRATNFTSSELKEAVFWAHRSQVKVYVVVNNFFHQKDWGPLKDFVTECEALGVDALIVSDIGAISLISQWVDLPIHVSTQASVLNWRSAKFYGDLGAKRVILGREVSLQAAHEIKERTDLEVEVFIHGSMCMAYSGHCTISNFTAGRDSNRGGCAHSCRFHYRVSGKKSYEGSFMSSKDLSAASLVQLAYQLGIDSLKVEGRMKGPLYIQNVTRVYSSLLKHLRAGELSEEEMKRAQLQLDQLHPRGTTTGNLQQRAGDETVSHQGGSEKAKPVAARVLEVEADCWAILEVRNFFYPQTPLIGVDGKGWEWQKIPHRIESLEGKSIEKTRPNQIVRIPYWEQLSVGQYLAKGECVDA